MNSGVVKYIFQKTSGTAIGERLLIIASSRGFLLRPILPDYVSFNFFIMEVKHGMRFCKKIKNSKKTTTQKIKKTHPNLEIQELKLMIVIAQKLDTTRNRIVIMS